MDILNSSAWMECLDDGPNTPHFRPILQKLPELIIPSIVITEVRKVILAQRTRGQADQVTEAMRSDKVVPIAEAIAISAADLFAKYKLPLADSPINAVALAQKATVGTQDSNFEGLSGVRYFAQIEP